jgi:protein-S-isoprenylcysteine O-methyltransferase Ste14
MSLPTLALCLLSLAAIGALPRIFFRPGTLNVRWWLTASPFFFTAALMLLAAGGVLTPAFAPAAPLLIGATISSAASLALIGFTLGTHRQPLSLWHQENDAPQQLVTWGAYSRIRHPFYSAFLLALLGCVAAFPHYLTLCTLIFAAFQLNRTAEREERRLLGSAFGAEYGRYLSHTGRFLPPFGRRSSLDRVLPGT